MLTISDQHGHTSVQQLVVVAGTPAKLKLAVQPTSVDGIDSCTVAVLDRFGNVCASDNTTQVILSLRPNHSCPQPVLLGPTTVTVNDGLATFTDVSVSNLTRARFVATAFGFIGVTSRVFQNIDN